MNNCSLLLIQYFLSYKLKHKSKVLQPWDFWRQIASEWLTITKLNGGSVVWIDTMIILFRVLAPSEIPLVWASLIVIQLSSGLLKASTTPDTELQRWVYTCAWGIPWLGFLGIPGQVSLCRTRTLAMEKSITRTQYRISVGWDTESDDTPAQRAHLGGKRKSIRQGSSSQTRMAEPPQERHRYGVFVNRYQCFSMFNEINDLH